MKTTEKKNKNKEGFKMKNYSVKFLYNGMLYFITEKAFTEKRAYKKAIKKARRAVK